MKPSVKSVSAPSITIPSVSAPITEAPVPALSPLSAYDDADLIAELANRFGIPSASDATRALTAAHVVAASRSNHGRVNATLPESKSETIHGRSVKGISKQTDVLIRDTSSLDKDSVKAYNDRVAKLRAAKVLGM